MLTSVSIPARGQQCLVAHSTCGRRVQSALIVSSKVNSYSSKGQALPCQRPGKVILNPMMRRTAETIRKEDLGGYVVVPQAAAEGQGFATPPVSAYPKASLGPVLACVAVASLGAFAFGYHLGVVNGPLAAIATDLGFGGNAALQGAVVSSTLAGAAAGSLTGSTLADNLGRRKAFLLDTIPLFLGPLLSATATGLAAMIAGRLIAGVGIGLASALVPLYISEVAPTEVRGLLGSVNQLVICIGILAALVVNVALPAASWRTMFWLAIIPAVILALGMLVAPESPRWLYSKGRTPEAETGARKLWGAAGPQQLSPAGDSEAGKGPAKSVSLAEALRNKSVLLGCALFVLQQLSGINAIVYFSSSVFARAGITSGALASAGVGAINVLGTVVAAFLMDRAGRKQLLTLSFAGMGVSMLAMSAGLGMQQFASMSGSIALFGTLAYVVCFSLGAGPVPGLLVPEITAIRLRGIAVSAAMVTHWVFNFGIGQLFLPAVTKFGVPTVYLFFTFICFLTVFFAKSQLVETKGMSLEQIEAAMAT